MAPDTGPPMISQPYIAASVGPRSVYRAVGADRRAAKQHDGFDSQTQSLDGWDSVAIVVCNAKRTGRPSRASHRRTRRTREVRCRSSG